MLRMYLSVCVCVCMYLCVYLRANSVLSHKLVMHKDVVLLYL